MLLIFFDIKGFVQKEFILADQTINSAHNTGDKRTGCCITTAPSHTSFNTGEFLAKNNTTVPHPLTPPYSPDLAPCDCSVSRHLDTTDVMEAESQAVPNTLTEHDIQDAVKNGRSADNGSYARNVDCFKGDGQ
jgi:hypothetical protein